MSGPIVRTGTTPEFWKNWDSIFGDKSGGKAKAKKSAKKATAKKKAAKKTPKKKSTGKAKKK